MSILPFPTILDDIKEKGLKKAVYEGINDIVERVTTGMNIQDIREALRGEAPSRRPNPRLQPHADGFWLHMRPSFFHRDMTGMYPTFRLGWLSTYFVVFETITGLFLMIWYTPSPQVAYENMLSIMGNVPLGQLMRDLHRLGAEAMVIIVILHMLRTFFTGSYKKPRQFTWFTGVLLLFFTLFLSFSGYLLPWDQLALWAVTIGASMVEATPPKIVGDNLNLLLRGGPEMGANGLLRFYLLHVLVVPGVLYIFLGVHYYKVIVHGHSLPPKSENIGEDTAKRVPLDKRVYFIPDVLTSEMMWIGVSTFIMVLLCVWFYHAPLENHADPNITPIGTTAPWYFLWIQGALKLGDKVLWGVIFPGVYLGFLAVMPYIDTTPSRRFADRRVWMSIGLVFVSATTVLSYMGLPEYGVSTAPENHVIHEMIKEPVHGEMGFLLPIPYEDLTIGAYSTVEFEESEAGEEGLSLRDKLAHFNEEIETGVYATAATNGTAQTQADMIGTRLISAHAISTNAPRFGPIPSDAQELKNVMSHFHELLEEEHEYLRNAWGGVIISQNQEGLKRIDVLLSWDQVELTDTGAAQLDAEGHSIPILDAEGHPVRLWASDFIFVHENASYFKKK